MAKKNSGSDTPDGRGRFAAALRDAMGAQNKSQNDIAEALGVSQSMVSYWCKGRSAPEPDKVFSLERLLRCTAGELSQHLGYLPITEGRPPPDIEAAVMASADLTPTGKRTALEVIRALMDYHRPRRGR